VYVIRTSKRRHTWSRKAAPVATAVNGGDYSITQVKLRFGLGDRLDEPVRTEHVPAAGSSVVIADVAALGYSDVLTPGTGLRAIAGDVEHEIALKAIPIVRWTDRWDQRWEYRQGVARPT
jgi:hypothetical protein